MYVARRSELKLKVGITMKSLVLMFLMVVPSIGFSEWERAGATDDGVWYVDASRIEVRNGYVYVWYLRNNYEPDALYDSLSTVYYDKVDCVNKRYQSLQVNWYTSHFGEQFIDSSTMKNPTWRYAEPASVAGGLSKVVCKLAGQ